MVLLIKLFFTLLAETIMLFVSFSEVVFEIDELSLELFSVSLLKKSSENKLPLIGVGGINSPQSAWERIAAGASLIQLYTGWIYEGPKLVTNILEGLSIQLDRHGFKNISEVVGSDAPWV